MAAANGSQPEQFAIVQGLLNLTDTADDSALESKREKLRRDVLHQCKTIKTHIREQGNKDELDLMRKQLARAFDMIVKSHYEFVEASHLTAVEEDEAYNFVREVRSVVKEALHLIDDYSQPDDLKDSGLSYTNRSMPTEISEPLGARSRILSSLQEMQIKELEERQRISELRRHRAREEQEWAKLLNREEPMIETWQEGKKLHGKYSTPVQSMKHSTFRPSVTFDVGSFDDDGQDPESDYNCFGPAPPAGDWITTGLRSAQSQNFTKWPESRSGSAMLFNMLPQVKFQPFTGDPKDWPEFIRMFKDMVHDVMPTNSQRMIVLRQLLSSEVKSYIADYLSSPDSYFAALHQLQRRYGQPQLVARAHLHTLRYLPKIRDDDPAGLVKLSRAVFGAIHALSGSGYEQDLESGMTLEIVVDKLPVRLRSSWGMKVYKMAPKRATLRDLALWLDAYAVGETMFDQAKPEFKTGKFKQNRNQTAILTTQLHDATYSNDPTVLVTQAPTQARNGKCPGCERDGHSIYKCATFRALDPQCRFDLVKSQGLCFRCLKSDHKSSECTSKRQCGLSGCTRKHHSLIHTEFKSKNATINGSKEGPSINAAAVKKVQGDVKGKAKRKITLLRVVPVKIRANSKELITYAVLDSGAEGTLIEESAASALGLCGPTEELVFGTFHGQDPAIHTQIVSFEISSLNGSHTEQVEGAYTVPNLNISRKAVDINDLKSKWPHLNDVDQVLLKNRRVSVLIGADIQEAHVPVAVRRPPKHLKGPYGILTPFGWCCVGSVPANDYVNRQILKISMQEETSFENLESLISQFWDIEAFGTRPDIAAPLSEMDQRAVKLTKRNTVFNGERYIVGLPWKTDDITLPNNRSMAMQRFLLLEKRFAKDSNFALRYAEVINEYLTLGHARKLRLSELDVGSPRIWYLPHHGVVNPYKPNKVRVVFDAAAKFKGVSLNDTLLTGPNLVTSSLTVLLRFRQRAIPISADIRKMFHQVGVRECDRSALRFLWREPGSSGPIETFEMIVQIFGAASSPFICTHTLRQVAEDFRSEFPDVADKVVSNFYVDNLLDSFDTEEEAIGFCQRVFQLLSRGGFHLNQWLSSSRRVLAALPQEDLSNPNLDLDLDELPAERTLGVWWKSEMDAFQFKFAVAEARTKRQVASVVATIYDPFGMLAPIVLIPKCIQQELWKEGVGWDQEIPNHISAKWKKWTKELNLVERLTIHRAFLRAQKPTNIELHAFSDASEIGYGAVVYLRVTYSDSDVTVSFVLAKSRVAPVKKLTIPRLELMGAVVAVRLVLESKRSLQFPIDRVCYWTDSKTVLQWINSKSCKFETFVANRIAEILELSNRLEWRHVPGILNPADDLSRGLLPSELTNDHRWFNGPAFLKESETSWPDLSIDKPSDNPAENWIGLVKAELKIVPINNFDMFLARSSQFTRVRRTVAFMLRFIKGKRMSKGPLSAPEIRDATFACIKYAQGVTFPDEIRSLQNGGVISTSSSIIKLTPFIDELGLLRVGGRIDNGSFEYDVRHPILLPNGHRITDLIILMEHRLQRHCSNERLLCHLRQMYWVVRGRHSIKTVVFNECSTCRRKHAKQIYPLMAPLPRHRLEHNVPPFNNVGIDFFGPYYVNVLRRTVKRYGLIFTCLVTRAVHIEITHTLDTDSFLMAFFRFAHRRGFPAVVYSDNGTQLTCGEKELRALLKQLDEEKITDKLSDRGIEWRFSPPAAPHFGGVWESLVKSAKRAFNAIVGNASISDELLLTFMSEAEFLLNNRPLTFVSVDPRDPEPLTPNHFLLGRPVASFPTLINISKPLDVRKNWLRAQTMLQHFWQRWLKEYLPSLTDRRKWLKPDINLKRDDIVLVADPASPKGKWPIGRVIEVTVGRDGNVRKALVKTSTGEYERPVAKLCLVESSEDGFVSDIKPPPAVSDEKSE